MDHEQAISTLAAERYQLREMSDAELDAFEEHYFSCPICAEDVRVSALMADGARAGWAGAGSAPSPASVPQTRRWYAAPALPWALAATLAVIATYQTVRGPGLPTGGPAHVLSPVTLRDRTRGADPVVTVAPGAPVTLALDIDVSGSAELAYDVARGGGAPLLSGRAPAPASGGPLLLLVPDGYLTNAGPYQVSVREAATGEAVGEFHFIVETHP